MSIDPNIKSDYILATPDKTIVNSGGKPIKKPKNTKTTEGKQVSEQEAIVFYVWCLKQTKLTKVVLLNQML